MTIKDYFSKTFETSDNHYIPTLKTHYYSARKEDAIKACNEVLKEMQSINKTIDEERGEIIVDAASFSGTVTLVNTSFSVVAVDIQVLTYNFFPTGKGKKVIEKFYELLDKKLILKQVGTR